MSTYVQSFEKLPMPAITICNKTAYKNHERNVDWNDYMENTLNLTEFLITKNFKIKPFSTMFYGRCYTITSSIKIAKFGHRINITFKARFLHNILALITCHLLDIDLLEV